MHLSGSYLKRVHPGTHSHAEINTGTGYLINLRLNESDRWSLGPISNWFFGSGEAHRVLRKPLLPNLFYQCGTPEALTKLMSNGCSFIFEPEQSIRWILSLINYS